MDRHRLAGPYVTSVGGTTGYDDEVAASISGGGFSFYFPRPPYQESVVPQFLKHLDKDYAGFYKCAHFRDNDLFSLDLCSPNGRGYPDIAGQALNFVIVVNSVALVVSGTSCSTPVGHSFLLPPLRVVHPRAPS